MKIKFQFLLISFLAGNMLSAAVTTAVASLQVVDGKTVLVNKLTGSGWKNAGITFPVYDGKAGKLLTGRIAFQDEAGKLRFDFSGKKFRYETVFTARGEVIYGEAAFTNSSDSEMWIEPGIKAAVNFTSAPEIFWDGFGKVRKIGKKPLERKGLKGLTMAHVGSKELPFTSSGVFNRHGGVHLGHRMFDDVSYSAAFFTPGKNELLFTQRYAVHPGETLKFTWVIGGCDARFGGAETVVQQHYDAFPERWFVDPENPFVWGNHAHYLNWKYRPDPEVTRRLKLTCDWAYTPYKRAGDIACREELWDYKFRNPIVLPVWLRFGGDRVPIYKMTREEFLKLRKEKYRKYGMKYGQLFYANCAGTWCEIDLAKKHYPDAVSDQDPHSNHLLKKWSTWHDWEVRVFPMGTSFASAFEEDMVKLTHELDLPGFSLDCCAGGVSYYGPATRKKLPGRAWDEKGVFIDQGVGVNHVIDFIHSIRPGMTVFANGPLKGDLMMFERDFVRTEELATMMPLYKWGIGPRPSVIHGGGYQFTNIVANWRNMNPDEFRETMFKLSVYQIFNQFKYGMGLTFIVQYGAPELVYIFPEFFELRRAGWRSSLPVRTGKELYAPYRAAYGKAENSFLFFGNSRAADSTGSVAVDNRLMSGYSGKSLIFVKKMRHTATIANRIRGNETHFRAILPARIPVLYETVCAISGAPEKMDVLASSRKSLSKEIYTAKLTKTPDFTGSITVRDIRGFDKVLKLNGKVIVPGSEQKLKAGDVITAEYTSQLFAVDQKVIDRFPFADSKKQLTLKVWFDRNDKAAAESAVRFEEFFTFLRKRGAFPSRGKVKFVHDPALRGCAGVITLDSRAKVSRIGAASGGGLVVEGTDGKTLDRNVCALLDRMDLRYPYIFPFAGCSGMPGNVLKHFGMTGKSLPLRKFFD